MLDLLGSALNSFAASTVPGCNQERDSMTAMKCIGYIHTTFCSCWGPHSTALSQSPLLAATTSSCVCLAYLVSLLPSTESDNSQTTRTMHHSGPAGVYTKQLCRNHLPLLQQYQTVFVWLIKLVWGLTFLESDRLSDTCKATICTCPGSTLKSVASISSACCNTESEAMAIGKQTRESCSVSTSTALPQSPPPGAFKRGSVGVSKCIGYNHITHGS